MLHKLAFAIKKKKNQPKTLWLKIAGIYYLIVLWFNGLSWVSWTVLLTWAKLNISWLKLIYVSTINCSLVWTG